MAGYFAAPGRRRRWDRSSASSNDKPTQPAGWSGLLRSSPANADGSPEVRPLSTFFGPMHPMEPRMDTAEGLVVVNQDAGSREGADRGSRRGAKQSRRVEQPRLSTVDDPLEHAGWGWPPTLKGYPRILAWGLDSAPAGAVKWELPLVLDAGLVSVSGWLEEQAARQACRRRLCRHCRGFYRRGNG